MKPAVGAASAVGVGAGRNRSVSMNRHAETPPTKKHRASDDESEGSTVEGKFMASTTTTTTTTVESAGICVGQIASATNPASVVASPSRNGAEHADTEEASGNGNGTTNVGVNTEAEAETSATMQTNSQTTPPRHGGSQSSGSSSEASHSPSASSSSSSPSRMLGANGAITEDSFMAWLLEQKQQGVPAGQMLDLLGLGVSDSVAVDDDELWDAMLSMGMRLIQPNLASRQKLEHVNTLEDVVSLLQRAQKIVVLAGAGISVSCGIPDFRSENGIYSRLSEYNLPNPQCMFDIDFFRTNPKPFFAFAKELFPKSTGFTFVPSRSHYFLKLLESKGKLLRVYSQNIDMLEHAAGISHERSILCHGSFATATCLSCKKVYPGDAIREEVMKQTVPMCQSCGSENGIVKPDIVFFGESLPRRFHDSIKADEDEADLVLVMGSSLKVNPVRGIVGRIHQDAPMVLINREPVGRPHKFDVELLGYSDEIVEELCRLLGWELPQPDPILLGLSNLTVDRTQTTTVRPEGALPFEFLPPSRHMFNGAIANSPSSSSEDEEAGESPDEYHNNSGVEGDNDEDGNEYDRRVLDVSMQSDTPEQGDAPIGTLNTGDDEEHEHLMGSGSELLRSGTLDDDMAGDDRL